MSGSHLGDAIRDLRDFQLRRNLFVDVLELAVLFKSLDPIAQVVVSQGSSLQSSIVPHHTKASKPVHFCLGERGCGILAAGTTKFRGEENAMAIPPKAKRKTKSKPYFKLLKPEAVGEAPWSVPDLCTAYNWPTNLVGGGIIAIVELGGGWGLSDLSAFFQSLGQPAPQMTDVSVDGTQNRRNQNVGSSDDPDYEVALDIEVAGAAYFAATGKAATIRVYWSQNIDTAVQKAAEDGCDVCSISWGADEAVWGTSAVQEMESVAASATSMGMVIFGAAGDNDSSDGGSTPANV